MLVKRPNIADRRHLCSVSQVVTRGLTEDDIGEVVGHVPQQRRND
jgi:hypothetical protein